MLRTLFLIFTILVSSVTALEAQQRRNPEMVMYEWKVIRVVDGDTVQFEALWIPAPIPQRISLRIYGVDTPEKGHRALCPSEAERGQRATDFTRNAITNSTSIRVALIDWDKYGGRVLGDVILDNNVSLRALLIRNGFAREYFGEAKQSWCN